MSAVSPDGTRRRREELARGEDGWRIWERTSPKSSSEDGSPSRTPFHARLSLHSALAVTDSSDSSGEIEDGRMDDGDSERSGPDWTQELLQTGGVKHVQSARRTGAALKCDQFDWKPTVNQFSEKLRREPNNIRFFDDDTPEAAGILKLVDDDDDVVGNAVKNEDRRLGRLAEPGGLVNVNLMPRGKFGPEVERGSTKLPTSPVYAPVQNNALQATAQPLKVPTSITESMVNHTSQPLQVPRSITEQFSRTSAPHAAVPVSITERFTRGPEFVPRAPAPPPVPPAPVLPPGISMTIAELVALAQQAIPSSRTMSPPAQMTSPPQVRPQVPAPITEPLSNRPSIPSSITDGIARRPGSASTSSVSSGASTGASSPWLGYNSVSSQRSQAATSFNLSPSPPPPHSFTGYPSVMTNTKETLSPVLYDKQHAPSGFSKTSSGVQQPYSWSSVSAQPAHSRGSTPGFQSPTAYHGAHSPAQSADPASRFNGAPRSSGAYAQWPGSQYAVYRG